MSDETCRQHAVSLSSSVLPACKLYLIYHLSRFYYLLQKSQQTCIIYYPCRVMLGKGDNFHLCFYVFVYVFVCLCILMITASWARAIELGTQVDVGSVMCHCVFTSKRATELVRPADSYCG